MENNRPSRRIRLPWDALDRFSVRNRNSSSTLASHRVPILGSLPLQIKNHVVAMISEFAGTFLFLLMAFSGTNVVNTAPNIDEPLNADAAKIQFISLCFGMSLAVNAWVFFRISGGLFNPAVTLAMILVGAVTYLRGLLVFISQIVGGIAASAVVYAMFPGPLNVSTSLGGGTSIAQGLFIEMFLTAQLVFTIFMLAAEKHRATFIAPVGIGLSLFVAELVGVYYTGGSLNPARSFGPAVVMGSFDTYHWIYWIGPMLGSLLATGFYLLVKALEYETVNPEQDHDGKGSQYLDTRSGTERSIAPVDSNLTQLSSKASLQHGASQAPGSPQPNGEVYRHGSSLEEGKRLSA